MERRELVFMDAKSSKFWNIELDGKNHTVTYGRTGTNGQTKTKEFSSDEKAKLFGSMKFHFLEKRRPMVMGQNHGATSFLVPFD